MRSDSLNAISEKRFVTVCLYLIDREGITLFGIVTREAMIIVPCHCGNIFPISGYTSVLNRPRNFQRKHLSSYRIELFSIAFDIRWDKKAIDGGYVWKSYDGVFLRISFRIISEFERFNVTLRDFRERDTHNFLLKITETFAGTLESLGAQF